MDADKQNVKIFKAFCDQNRLQIIQALHEKEKYGCELLEKMDLSQSTFSHHMKILVDSGIVVSRRTGKRIYYSLDDKGCEQAISRLSFYIGNLGAGHSENRREGE